MKLIEQVIIETLGEDGPVIGPVRPLQRNHVPFIDYTYSLGEPAV